MEKEYEEKLAALSEEDKINLLKKFIDNLGFKRIRHEETRGKFVVRFRRRDEL